MKILVFTVTAWNSKVGANTWETLLEQYGSENVANVCIRDEIPDSKVCSKYFAISENKIIKSIFNRRIKTGKEILAGNVNIESEEDLALHDQLYAKYRKKRSYFYLMARELVWKLGKWRTKEFDNFLDEFKPDVILHSMEGYIHLNRIINYAIKRTKAKAVGYIWDDNFSYKQSSSLGFKIYRFFQRKSLKRLAKKTQAFFAISSKTKVEADKFFGINSTVVTKPIDEVLLPTDYTKVDFPLKFIYTGNLLIGRDRSLLKINNCLNQIPEAKDKVKIEVYTQTKLDENMIKMLEGDFCQVNPAVPQEEALQKQKEADVLLFLEDIDGKDAKTARLSFSTKITDYLSCGKCIFAVGCLDTAPMQYFKENDIALVAGKENEIKENFRIVLQETKSLNKYADNVYVVAKDKHNKEKILQIVRQTLDNVVSKTK